MKRESLLIWIIVFLQIPAIAQLESGSTLPILLVDTDGLFILDEPKTKGEFTIYFNPEKSVNRIDPDDIHYQGQIGIEKRGQSSLNLFPKNGYGLETRDEEGENDNVALFGWPKENDWVLHGPYSDKTMIRNAMSYKLASQVLDYAPRIMLCELVVNDSYEGVYLFTEKIKRDKGRVDISKLKEEDITGDQLTGGYILKFDKGDGDEYGWSSDYSPNNGGFQTADYYIHYPKPGNLQDEQRDYIKNIFDEFEDVLKSENFNDSLDGYWNYIDIESFIDFILIQEITGNVDSYRISTYFYKDRDSIDHRIKMGPAWDFNLSFGNANYCNGQHYTGWRWNFNTHCPDDFWLNHFWWTRFAEDDRFKIKLKETWQNYRSTIWTDEKLIACADSLVSVVQPAANRNFNRWPILGQWVWPNNMVASSFNGEVNNMKNWLINRVEWMDNAVENFIVGNEKNILDDGVLFSPNPNNGNFSIRWNRIRIRPNGLFIFNALGKLMHQQEIAGSDINRLDLELDLPPGLYLYTLENYGEHITESFIVR